MLKKAAILTSTAAAAALALAPLAHASGDDEDPPVTGNYISFGNTIDCSNYNGTSNGGASALAPVQPLTNALGGILGAGQYTKSTQAGSVASPQNTHCNAAPIVPPQ
jgi:hypothetical protein